MVKRKFLLYVSFMIYTLTLEHYIPPLNYCLQAMTCNHSWIPVCGLKKNENCYRMFLDECDMYEYNCDNKTGFIYSDLSNCNQISKSTNQNICNNIQNIVDPTIANTQAPTIEATTVKRTTVASSNTTALCTSSTVINNNSTERVTTQKKQRSDTTKDITINQSTVNNIEEGSTMINTADINNLINENETTEIVTESYLNTEPYVDTLIPTFRESTHKTTQYISTAVSNFTEITILSNETEASTENTTETEKGTRETHILMSTTTSERATNVSTITKEVTNTIIPVTEQTTKPDCDFPSYCDRPKVWLTTSKGETRDFYRIIRDNDSKKN